MSEIEFDNANIRSMLSENNAKFRLADFFERSNTMSEGCAVSVITSKQIITTMTENDGCGHHSEMIEKILQAIYDLPLLNDYKVIKKVYAHMNSSIIIRMWFVDGCKYFAVEFPKSITEEQLNMLAVYQRVYGSEIDRISAECTNHFLQSELLEFELLLHGQIKREYTFSDIVAYAKSLVAQKELNSEEEYIIGFTEKKFVECLIPILQKKNCTLSMCNEVGNGDCVKNDEKDK